MEETKTIFLADGRKIILDDDDLILSFVSSFSGESEEAFSLFEIENGRFL